MLIEGTANVERKQKDLPIFYYASRNRVRDSANSGMTDTGPNEDPLLINQSGNWSMDTMKSLSWKLRGTSLSESHPLQAVEVLATVKGIGGLQETGHPPATDHHTMLDHRAQGDTHPERPAFAACHVDKEVPVLKGVLSPIPP